MPDCFGKMRAMSDSSTSPSESKRPKGIYLALGALTLIAIVGAAYGFLAQASYQRTADDRIAQIDRLTREKAFSACTELDLKEQPRCYASAVSEHELSRRENERNEYDLVAQRQSALWTSIMGVAALFGMGLSALGAWLVWTTFRETRRTADVAVSTRNDFIEAERGRLDVKAGKPWADDAGPHFSLLISNSGRTAVRATKVYFWMWQHNASTLEGEWIKADDLAVTVIAGGTYSHTARLVDAARRVFIGGYVEYVSSFGQRHRAHFYCSGEYKPPEPPYRGAMWAISALNVPTDWPSDS